MSAPLCKDCKHIRPDAVLGIFGRLFRKNPSYLYAKCARYPMPADGVYTHMEFVDGRANGGRLTCANLARKFDCGAQEARGFEPKGGAK
jgi:hypothetical protein